MGQCNPNFFDRIFYDKRTELDMVKHFRILFTKALVAKITLGFFLYNKALVYFFEISLRMPDSVAKTFGNTIGSMLKNRDN